ncbi:hypothetical protein SASPL_154482 [Salvia splendens]|uniref:Uncharacterized protein n=1 Tax=Salvia splendens TaxID=180675 RepID=A0A8X8YYS2_SALSN|nr:hypothetical protein SASPL_154482 [Salvia splendens]
MLSFSNQFFGYRQNALVHVLIANCGAGGRGLRRQHCDDCEGSLPPPSQSDCGLVVGSVYSVSWVNYTDFLTRLQFFVIVFTTSYAYYEIPAYFFPTISSISLLCYIWKDSILMQQLGSGLHSMGIGSFAFDWATVSFIGDPIATPDFAIINVVVCFILVMYVVTPITYFNNIYQARKFPFFSSATFDDTGMKYNISRILNEATFSFNVAGYETYSKLHISAFFAFTYGIGFAMLSATIVHVVLVELIF